MKWYQLPLGALQTNCYVVANEHDSCLIFDPGGEPEKLIEFVENKNLHPVGIVLTHAHFDHIGAVDGVREHYSIPVHVHEKEASWLDNPALNGSSFFLAGEITAGQADVLISGPKQMELEGFSFEVMETPGHSPGSITCYFKDGGFAVVGDTLFQGSIGRTDLPGGNHSELIENIHGKLLVLPEEAMVLPGHGPVTTIGREMISNPFLNGF